MIKNLKAKMLKLGLSPKKEFLTLIISDVILLLASVALLLVTKTIIYSLFGVGIIMIFDLLFLTRYSRKIEAKNIENLQEFATLFGYFRIFIHNGYSVYSALKELLIFANDDLKALLQKLLSDIDNDKSVQPFIEFSKAFDEIIVEEMMISIYQLVDDGETSDYLMQFELIFDKFSDLLYQRYLRSKDSKLGAIGSSALIGSCFLIIVLTIGIINIIGELINGI